MKKVLALVLGLCMLASLVSVSAFAEDYTPTYSYDYFFNGSSGEGFLRTKVDYDNDGEKEDYYIAYGLNGYYTSTDGINWDMRSQISNLRSLAYGNDVGIAILAKGSETARLFGDDLNSASEVYNKLADDNPKWIELHPNIYFDKLSGLFFCHGFEYETWDGKNYDDIGLYYTDGKITSETYPDGKTVSALTWTEVTGDVFTGEGFKNKTKTYSELTDEKLGIIGDGAGSILVSYHGHCTSNTYNPNPKNYYSFLTVTTDKNVTATYAQGSGMQTFTEATPNTLFFDGNIIFSGSYKPSGGSYASRYQVGTVSDGVVTINKSGHNAFSGITTDYGFDGIYENNSTVYLRKGADLYQTTLIGTELAAFETNTDGSPKSITAGIYETLNGYDPTHTYSVKDMLFLDDGSIVLMVNETKPDDNKTVPVKAYLILLETDADPKLLSADATYTHFTGTGSEALTDTTARGYRVDAGFKSYSIPARAGYARDGGFTATISGDGSQYFEGSGSAYTTVSAAAPAGQYTINYFLTIDNQPSIFATKTAVYNVVPRFTTSVGVAAAADEAYTASLAAGANTVTVTFDDLKRYVTSSTKNFDDTLESSFLVMGARYNSNHQMQEVVDIYDTAKLTAGEETSIITTPFDFEVTNAAAGDYLKVFILDGFTKLISLW